jgi:ABC-type multidrug transport system fused ATPase/permease subunit
MLCDEITSSIDLKTDAAIHDVLLSLDCTVLAICHRLHRIRDFDRILILDHGAVIEDGVPLALAKDPNSVLSNMLNHSEVRAH